MAAWLSRGSAYLATAIATCGAVLFFVSPPRLRLQPTLATTHALMRYSLNRDAYRAQLIAALNGQAVADTPPPRRLALTPRQRERWVWAGALAITLAAATCRPPSSLGGAQTRSAPA